MTGLHSCKPGNEPVVGQVKTFIAEQRVGKSGKAYTKIKSAPSDQGGQPYKITSVKPTGFTDAHDNISFNLEIEPSNMVASDQVPPSSLRAGAQVKSGMTKDDYWTRKEERDIEAQDRMGRAHSQEMTLRYFVAKGDTDITTEKVRAMTDWFQRDLKRQPYSAVEQQAKTMFNATEVPAEGEEENEIPF